MMKPINIIDSDYAHWIKELSSRYRRSQIKAAYVTTRVDRLNELKE